MLARRQHVRPLLWKGFKIRIHTLSKAIVITNILWLFDFARSFIEKVDENEVFASSI